VIARVASQSAVSFTIHSLCFKFTRSLTLDLDFYSKHPNMRNNRYEQETDAERKERLQRQREKYAFTNLLLHERHL
jgi:hypothetical protein